MFIPFFMARDGCMADVGEVAELYVTSPYEGTSLIHYPLRDVVKVVDDSTSFNWRGRVIKLPWHVIGFDVKRPEYLYLQLRQRPVPTEIILSVVEACLPSQLRSRFVVESNGQDLTIYLPAQLSSSDTPL
ncbi:MAG: hypothetical protein DRJ97_08005 [Thermoprotei archaeon]|nr:MAG: hypothetical protein DRJ97_08005 [Thermoprotei archaeon]